MNTKPREEELRWIEVLLEEANGGIAALEGRNRRPLLAAAIVLLGISAVAAAMLAPRREAEPQPAQEPTRPAPAKETVVEPKDDAELRALLATLRSVQVRCRVFASIDQHQVSFRVDPKAEVVIRDPVQVQTWARELAASVGKTVTLKAIDHSVELRCTLADGRLLLASAMIDPVPGVYFGAREEAAEPTEALAALLLAAHGAAERAGRRGNAAADLDELAAMPDSQEELACPALTGAQVRTLLSRFTKLRTLAMVEQPGKATPDGDTCPALAGLASLRSLTLIGPDFDGRTVSALRPLELHGLTVHGCTSFTAVGMRELATWNALDALQLIDVPAASDPEALASLKSFRTLHKLGLEAQALTDACIEELLTTRLQVLRLRGGAGLTGKGLARLAALPSLRHLELCGIATANDAVPVLGQLPMLGRLFTRGAWLADTDADELGKLRQLRRLDLRNTGIGTEAGARLRTQLPDCEIPDPAAGRFQEPSPIGNFAQALTGVF
jgi:hypothetical protein